MIPGPPEWPGCQLVRWQRTDYTKGSLVPGYLLSNCPVRWIAELPDGSWIEVAYETLREACIYSILLSSMGSWESGVLGAWSRFCPDGRLRPPLGHREVKEVSFTEEEVRRALADLLASKFPLLALAALGDK